LELFLHRFRITFHAVNDLCEPVNVAGNWQIHPHFGLLSGKHLETSAEIKYYKKISLKLIRMLINRAKTLAQIVTST
jgi:hypothetical protein